MAVDLPREALRPAVAELLAVLEQTTSKRILVEGDPTTNIGDIRRVAMVITQGSV